MSRRWKLAVGLVSVAVACVLVGCAFLVGTPRHPMTKDQAALVQREVPLGASAAEVTTWLDARDIEHSPYEQEHGGGQMLSIIRDTRRSFLVSTDIQMIFTFDGRARLTGRSVREVFTGL